MYVYVLGIKKKIKKIAGKYDISRKLGQNSVLWLFLAIFGVIMMFGRS